MELCFFCGRIVIGDGPRLEDDEPVCGRCADLIPTMMLLTAPIVHETDDDWTYDERFNAAVFDALAAQDGGLDW